MCWFRKVSRLYDIIYNEVLWVLAFHEADGDVGRYFIASSIADKLEKEINEYIKDNGGEH